MSKGLFSNIMLSYISFIKNLPQNKLVLFYEPYTVHRRSIGLKFLDNVKQKLKKHQNKYRRQQRKLHIGIDTKTPQICTVSLTTNNVSNSQMFINSLDQIQNNERIDSIYTNGAYDTKSFRQVIWDRQTHAVIPPRNNAMPCKYTRTHSLERNKWLKSLSIQAERYGKQANCYRRSWDGLGKSKLLNICFLQ